MCLLGFPMALDDKVAWNLRQSRRKELIAKEATSASL